MPVKGFRRARQGSVSVRRRASSGKRHFGKGSTPHGTRASAANSRRNFSTLWNFRQLCTRGRSINADFRTNAVAPLDVELHFKVSRLVAVFLSGASLRGAASRTMGEGMSTIRSVCFIVLVSFASSLLLAHPSFAQESPFQNGWTLRRDASSIRFQTVKNVTKVESSTFAEFEGAIDETGAAKIIVFLDSVDTKIDLRNVRMRFLLFETFQFPKAVITAQIEPAQLSDLPSMKRKFIPLKFNVELHGVQASFDTEVSATLLNDDLVAISSTVPISIPTSAFNLDGGVKKLEEAAKVTIIPSATVSFDLVFAHNGAEAKEAETNSATDSQLAASKALEPKGNLDVEACKGRFEILSRTDNIYFTSGSARLDARSEPLLNSIVDIISRCPELIIEVSGHTDSDGPALSNMRLSELRAAAVAQYLASKNIPKERIRNVGFGETRPVASNQTAEGKYRNRRIEFAVVQ